MAHRSVWRRREDSAGVYTAHDVDIDMLALLRAASVETLLNGLAVRGFASLFADLLAPSPRMLWRGRGPGAGRELRRSYSNLLGRFVARAYLESFEQVQNLLSIEGDRFVVPASNLMVRRRKGVRGDLPDWIGRRGSLPIIAEAKGSHDKRSWWNKKWPAVVENARAQVRRVEIVRVDASGRKQRGTQPELFESWAVASKWATEVENPDPILVAVQETHIPGKAGLQHLSLGDGYRSGLDEIFYRRLIKSMGFEDGSRPVFQMQANDDPPAAPGVVSLLGWFGVLPLRAETEAVLPLEWLRQGDEPLVAVSLSYEALESKSASDRVAVQYDYTISRDDITVALVPLGGSLTLRRA